MISIDTIWEVAASNAGRKFHRLHPNGPRSNFYSGHNGGPFANEVDGSQVSESREIGFATRELLVERVKRLVAALDRLNAGEYGTCVECAAVISAARLRAAPEVQTCVRCQDRLERHVR